MKSRVNQNNSDHADLAKEDGSLRSVAAVCWRVWWLRESNSSVDGASDGSLSRCKEKRKDNTDLELRKKIGLNI